MSHVYRVSPSWKGFSNLHYLVIFGDSYSDVGLQYSRSLPTAVQPLGYKFPGLTFNEPDEPNWVGHLITKYSPPPRFDPSLKEHEHDPAYLESPLLVYDFAVGGATVAGVRDQVEKYFLKGLALRPAMAGVPWNAEDTLFITWVGINDIGGFTKSVAPIEQLIDTQEILYSTGARNFLFVDVPPIQLSPAWSSLPSPLVTAKYEDWNSALRRAIESFSDLHSDASVFLFSSYQLFDSFLRNPLEYNLKAEDVHKAGGEVWIDHLHPTSKVHDIIASNLANFLNNIDAMPGNDPDREDTPL